MRPTRRPSTRLPAQRVAAALWIAYLAAAAPVCASMSPLADQLRQVLEAQRAGAPVTTAGRPLRAAPAVQDFYARRVYEPAWFADGRLLDTARAVLPLLASSRDDGLHPESYGYAALRRELAGTGDKPTAMPRVELELALTDAVLDYASDMLRGRVRPETLYPAWESAPRELDLARYLQEALDGGRLVSALRDLAPRHPDYLRLRDLLARYRQIEQNGGLATIPSGVSLKPGMMSQRVVSLRQRLRQGGDLSADHDDGSDIYDTDVEAAVGRYQSRHGLEPDGIAGPETLASLNVAVEHWIQVIELNMERWRWLPQDLGERYIMVNIAGFQLDLVEQDKVRLSMPVVVGKRYHETPVFTASMTYVVFNPYWNVPSGIAVKEILPKLRQDPTYLDRESMKVFRGWGVPVDPATIDWNRVDAKGFPYLFRQEPGPKNALGRVKFMFPNRYNVYLHDTPAKELFSKASRGFSHGCIRVSRPARLAEYLLRDKPEWNADRIARAEADGAEQTVRLAKSWPVHILYWTAWVDPGGDVQFRPDIYGRDARLARALYN